MSEWKTKISNKVWKSQKVYLHTERQAAGRRQQYQQQQQQGQQQEYSKSENWKIKRGWWNGWKYKQHHSDTQLAHPHPLGFGRPATHSTKYSKHIYWNNSMMIHTHTQRIEPSSHSICHSNSPCNLQSLCNLSIPSPRYSAKRWKIPKNPTKNNILKCALAFLLLWDFFLCPLFSKCCYCRCRSPCCCCRPHRWFHRNFFLFHFFTFFPWISLRIV